MPEWNFLSLSIGTVKFCFKGYSIFFQANSGDPDQTLHSVASDLGLHCLPMSHQKDTRLLTHLSLASFLWEMVSFLCTKG